MLINRKQNIKRKLAALKPHFLEITNKSKEHFGHAGNPTNNEESHFEVKIASTELNKYPRIQQHRIINTILKTEFDNGLHALSIIIKK